MRKRKGKFKHTLLAGLAVAAMTVQSAFGGIATVEAAVTVGTSDETYINNYGGSYTPESIFSHFQLFAEEDLKVGSHTMGAIAGNNLLTLGTFGDVQFVPSYVNNITSSVSGSSVIFQGGTKGYTNGNPNFYYSSEAVVGNIANMSANDNGKVSQNTNTYIDFEAAFEALGNLSNGYSTGLTKVEAENNSITLNIPSDADSKFLIDYNDLKDLTGSPKIKLNIEGVTSQEDAVKVFQNYECIISIVNVNNTDFTLDFKYGEIHLLEQAMSSALQKLPNDGTVEFSNGGMKLIWNFPDATSTITTVNGHSGHLLAPDASVYMGSGNYEGGVIAKNIETVSEGHFYPYNAKTTSDDTPTETTKTATATFSKKTVSADGAELAGASMKLVYTSGSNNLSSVTRTTGGDDFTKDADNKVITWTSTTTPMTLTGLPEGEYTLSEVAPPTGYMYAAAISFKVASDGNIYQMTSDGTYSNEATTTLTMVDKAKVGSITFTGTKNVKGEGAPSETYQFTVKNGTKTVSTGTATGSGQITFDSITYGPEDVGQTYTYTITETVGATTNMNYDSSTKTVKVEVTELKDSLQAEIVTTESDEIVFTNTYTAQESENPTVTGSVTISKKAIVGGEELPGASLKLISSDVTDLSVVTATNATPDNGYIASYDAVTWTSTNTALKLSQLPVGEYTLTETGAPAGYKYASNIQFKVDTDGKVYLWNGSAYESTDTSEIVMVDEAKAGSLILQGMKILTGEDVPDETYEFVVKENGQKVATGLIDKAGTFSFTTITYGPEDIGSHTYTITETQGTTAGMNYDTNSCEVTVTVSDGGKDSDVLAVTMSSLDFVATFTNRYTKSTEEEKTKKGTLVLKVVEEETSILVPGSEVTVTDENGKIVGTYTIDDDETKNKIEVPAGTYTVTIKDVPTGYEKGATEEVKVTVPENGTTTATLEVDKTTTETSKGTLVLKVVEEETSTLVPGSEVTVTDENGKIVGTYTIDDDETKNKIEVPAGDYTVTIKDVPTGYEKGATEEVKVTVPENGTETAKLEVKKSSDDETDTPVDTTNKTVTISKKALTAGGAELAGAILKITSSTNSLKDVTVTSGNATLAHPTDNIIQWTSTNESVELSGLPAGEYTLMEDAAPAGYKCADSIYFKVYEDGTIGVKKNADDANYESLNDSTITMVDEAIEVVISKKSLTAGGAELPGAKLTLTSISDTPINLAKVTSSNGIQLSHSTDGYSVSWTSTNTAVTLNMLPAGKYQLSEDTAPAGYKVADSITFTVEKDGTVNVYNKDTNSYESIANATVTMVDESKETITSQTGTLSFTVVEEGTNKTVPKAEVVVKDSDGEETTYITDENGTITVPDLIPGTYTVTVKEVPEGYKVVTEESVTVEVKAGKNTDTTFEVKNETSEGTTEEPEDEPTTEEPDDEPTTEKGTLTFKVVEEGTDRLVPGAEVTVKEANESGNGTTYTTNEDGEITVSGLTPGNYTVTVTKVPEGYTVTTNTAVTVEVKAGDNADATFEVKTDTTDNNNSNGGSTNTDNNTSTESGNTNTDSNTTTESDNTNSDSTNTSTETDSDDDSTDSDEDTDDDSDDDSDDDEDEDTSSGTKSSSAKTGDAVNPFMIGLFAIAFAGIFVFLLKKRRGM